MKTISFKQKIKTFREKGYPQELIDDQLKQQDILKDKEQRHAKKKKRGLDEEIFLPTTYIMAHATHTRELCLKKVVTSSNTFPI